VSVTNGTKGEATVKKATLEKIARTISQCIKKVHVKCNCKM